MRAVLAVAVLAGTAHASHGSYPETDDDKRDDVTALDADRAPQLEGSVGFELGTFHTGPVYNFAYGLALDGGIRLDKLALMGEYAFLGLASPASATTTTTTGGTALETMPTDTTPTGFVQRFGLASRYSVAKGASASHGLVLRFDTWVEAGLGEQLLRWNGGGYLHRPDVEIAFGVQLNVRGIRHHGGYFMGMRVTLADPPKMIGPPAPPTCAGPCDGPTGPIGLDRSILFVMAVDFGG